MCLLEGPLLRTASESRSQHLSSLKASIARRLLGTLVGGRVVARHPLMCTLLFYSVFDGHPLDLRMNLHQGYLRKKGAWQGWRKNGQNLHGFRVRTPVCHKVPSDTKNITREKLF